MAVTNYTTIGGVIVHEDRGGTQRNYVPDTLGSAAKMTDATTVTDTFEYWPYGEQRSHTGSNTTSFTYVGTLGYCQVGNGSAMTYVRARMYLASRGRWAMVDPLWIHSFLWPLTVWPGAGIFLPYTYADSRPVEVTDRMGLWTVKICIQPTVPPIITLCEPLPGTPPGITVSTDTGKNLLDFNYGLYCGAKVRCEPNEGLDCIDRACREHDSCTERLPGWQYFFGIGAKKCHCKLALDALLCATGGCHFDNKGGVIGAINCNAAAGEIAIFFGIQCRLTPIDPFGAL